MNQIRRNVSDIVTLKRCKRTVCCCMDKFKSVSSLTIKDVNLHNGCYNSSSMQDAIKVKLCESKINNKDPSYPPLL